MSGNEDVLINSWTKNKIEHEEPTLYSKDDNIYFVVQLKDTVQHFFLPGWFDDMDAPVTSVAMISKINTTANVTNPEMADSPFSAIPQSEFNLPTMPMPSMPTDPIIITPEFKNALDLSKNRNVIIGNWEVQNYYRKASNNKVDATTGLTPYEARFGSTVYSDLWNFFQDTKNHYKKGSLYRTQTISIQNDVNATELNGNYFTTTYGTNSSVMKTDAAATTANPFGLPYAQEVVDSINVDFQPEVEMKESSKWLSQDWDLSMYDSESVVKEKVGVNPSIDWDTSGFTSTSTGKDKIKRLRIHSSINFDGAYEERAEKYRERDENGNLIKDDNNNVAPDILWVRIESEPMLNHPDIINAESKGNNAGNLNKGVGIRVFNSVNQIIINNNASNYSTATKNFRPVVIFYDGPETNDVYETESNKKHIRDSLPVILNLNKPFRGVLYAPNSPVVVIGDSKDNFQGFVVAKKYMRLKDERDFEYAGYTNLTDLSLKNLQTYYALDDPTHKNPCYKITDENEIEMFVDAHGDIQFADFPAVPTRYGKYDNFGRKTFSTHGYEVLQYSASNMLLSGK